jgi:hypothetical protein
MSEIMEENKKYTDLFNSTNVIYEELKQSCKNIYV